MPLMLYWSMHLVLTLGLGEELPMLVGGHLWRTSMSSLRCSVECWTSDRNSFRTGGIFYSWILIEIFVEFSLFLNIDCDIADRISLLIILGRLVLELVHFWRMRTKIRQSGFFLIIESFRLCLFIMFGTQPIFDLLRWLMSWKENSMENSSGWWWRHIDTIQMVSLEQSFRG